MDSILDTIVKYKVREVAERKMLHSVKSMEVSPLFIRPVYSLREALQKTDSSGIIAEFKRKSPSQGWINREASVEKITSGYLQAGAAALSVLTDQNFFGGNTDDIIKARSLNASPILRKEFIVEEYQVLESKAVGADGILLIAAALSSEQIKSFTVLAHSLGMEVLLEVHNETELMKNLESGADLIGVNNRNLNTFQVSLDVSYQLADRIPDHIIKVSESGIDSTDAIVDLHGRGYRGFLIGQSFMKQVQPDKSCAEFIKELYKRKNHANISD